MILSTFKGFVLLDFLKGVLFLEKSSRGVGDFGHATNFEAIFGGILTTLE